MFHGMKRQLTRFLALCAVAVTMQFPICIAQTNTKAARATPRPVKHETPHLEFVAEYIRELAAVEQIREAAQAEDNRDKKDDRLPFSGRPLLSRGSGVMNLPHGGRIVPSAEVIEAGFGVPFFAGRMCTNTTKARPHRRRTSTKLSFRGSLNVLRSCGSKDGTVSMSDRIKVFDIINTRQCRNDRAIRKTIFVHLPIESHDSALGLRFAVNMKTDSQFRALRIP